MNQRSGRNRDGTNKVNFISVNTGGHVARHAPNEDPKVQVPPKTTGETKPEVPAGAAKASPNFKPVKTPEKTLSKDDEKKVIANNSEAVDKKDE